MTFEHSDLKFRVKVNFEGYTFNESDLNIVVRNARNEVLYTIPKDEMFCDSEGNPYFTLEDVPNGRLFAYLTASIPDDDYEKGTRTVTDVQLLHTVGKRAGGCRNKDVVRVYDGTAPVIVTAHHHCHCHEQKVTYEQVWTVNLDGYIYLADREGNLILTADGCAIMLHKDEL